MFTPCVHRSKTKKPLSFLKGLILFIVEATMPESNEIIKDLAKIQHVKFL